jgi:phosphatidylserine/phosphatidylglycerophosphate/cardiolipin synthase-like enzyme
VRRQNNVHNKGVVVDGAVVMVSSQNWSADGTLRNRDAGLILHDVEAAAYFEEIFLHDWDNLARPVRIIVSLKASATVPAAQTARLGSIADHLPPHSVFVL